MIQIDKTFIEEQTEFTGLVAEIHKAFYENQMIVPKRHHHDFPNSVATNDTTMLLMPAWNTGKSAGVKIVTVNPENDQYQLPSIQGTYLYLDANTGVMKAIMEAKSLTVKRTAATSALASSFLSREDSNSLLMIGTGALATNLIEAHAAVRPIEKVYVWGRNYEKAVAICEALQDKKYQVTAIESISEKVSEVDIISCATLSKTPLVLGHYLKAGQHIDLVGAYKPDMRESDDAAIIKASVFLDTYQSGLHESGDIAIPLSSGLLYKEAIKADLFELCSATKKGRTSHSEITLFKSVGHAMEDLAAADYYYKKYTNA